MKQILLEMLKKLGAFLWYILGVVSTTIIKVFPKQMVGPQNKLAWLGISFFLLIFGATSLNIVLGDMRLFWSQEGYSRKADKIEFFVCCVVLVAGILALGIVYNIPSLPPPTQAQIIASLNRSNEVLYYDKSRQVVLVANYGSCCGDEPKGLHIQSIEKNHIITKNNGLACLNDTKKLRWQWGAGDDFSDGYLVCTK